MNFCSGAQRYARPQRITALEQRTKESLARLHTAVDDLKLCEEGLKTEEQVNHLKSEIRTMHIIYGSVIPAFKTPGYQHVRTAALASGDPSTVQNHYNNLVKMVKAYKLDQFKSEIRKLHATYDSVIPHFKTPGHQYAKMDALASTDLNTVQSHYDNMERLIQSTVLLPSSCDLIDTTYTTLYKPPVVNDSAPQPTFKYTQDSVLPLGAQPNSIDSRGNQQLTLSATYSSSNYTMLTPVAISQIVNNWFRKDDGNLLQTFKPGKLYGPHPALKDTRFILWKDVGRAWCTVDVNGAAAIGDAFKPNIPETSANAPGFINETNFLLANLIEDVSCGSIPDLLDGVYTPTSDGADALTYRNKHNFSPSSVADVTDTPAYGWKQVGAKMEGWPREGNFNLNQGLGCGGVIMSTWSLARILIHLEKDSQHGSPFAAQSWEDDTWSSGTSASKKVYSADGSLQADYAELIGTTGKFRRNFKNHNVAFPSLTAIARNVLSTDESVNFLSSYVLNPCNAQDAGATPFLLEGFAPSYNLANDSFMWGYVYSCGLMQDPNNPGMDITTGEGQDEGNANIAIYGNRGTYTAQGGMDLAILNDAAKLAGYVRDKYFVSDAGAECPALYKNWHGGMSYGAVSDLTVGRFNTGTTYVRPWALPVQHQIETAGFSITTQANYQNSALAGVTASTYILSAILYYYTDFQHKIATFDKTAPGPPLEEEWHADYPGDCGGKDFPDFLSANQEEGQSTISKVNTLANFYLTRMYFKQLPPEQMLHVDRMSLGEVSVSYTVAVWRDSASKPDIISSTISIGTQAQPASTEMAGPAYVQQSKFVHGAVGDTPYDNRQLFNVVPPVKTTMVVMNSIDQYQSNDPGAGPKLGETSVCPQSKHGGFGCNWGSCGSKLLTGLNAMLDRKILSAWHDDPSRNYWNQLISFNLDAAVFPPALSPESGLVVHDYALTNLWGNSGGYTGNTFPTYPAGPASDVTPAVYAQNEKFYPDFYAGTTYSWPYNTLFLASNAEIYDKTYIGDNAAAECTTTNQLEKSVNIPISFSPDPLLSSGINAQYLSEDGNKLVTTRYAEKRQLANNGRFVDVFQGLLTKTKQQGVRNLGAFSVANCIYMTPMLVDFDAEAFELDEESEPIFPISPYQWLSMAAATPITALKKSGKRTFTPQFRPTGV